MDSDFAVECIRAVSKFFNGTARASAILATGPQIFIRFRELMSARGNALLQLSKPIQHDVDLCRRFFWLDGLDHQESSI